MADAVAVATAAANGREGNGIDCPLPARRHGENACSNSSFVRIAMGDGGIRTKRRVEGAVVIKVPSEPSLLFGLKSSRQGYLDEVAVNATLLYDKGRRSNRLGCRCY